MLIEYLHLCLIKVLKVHKKILLKVIYIFLLKSATDIYNIIASLLF